MRRLLLVRHGNTFEKDQTPVFVGRRTDLGLTQEGVVQATNLARELRYYGFNFSKVFAGPLRRQIRTAEILRESLCPDLEVLLSDDLAEVDYGLWEGLTVSSIQERWPNEYREWTEHAIWPSNVFQTSESLCIQNLDLFLNLVSREDGDVAAVTSNGILRLIFARLSPMWPSLVKAGKVSVAKVRTGAYCVVHLDEAVLDKWSIEQWDIRP